MPNGGCAAPCPLSDPEAELGFGVSMAFQPMVDVVSQEIWAYEALVRGTSGESAPSILAQVNDRNQYMFDQICRVKAIELAAQLGVARRGIRLSLNFLPSAVYDPRASLNRTIAAAHAAAFGPGTILFEITEGQRFDIGHMRKVAAAAEAEGFRMALDDFGSGFSGLHLLSALGGVHLVKLDASLIRHIDCNLRGQKVVASVLDLCRDLGVEVLAECVETWAEYATLASLGIRLMQGFFFARPAFEALPLVVWPTRYQETEIATQPHTLELPSLAFA